MITTVFTVLITASCMLLALTATCAVISLRRQRAPIPPLPFVPMISILKPMKHADEGLEENIESFFRLTYPAYEVIFGVETLDDECVEIAERVSRRYPHIPSRIAVTGTDRPLNPKIGTLSRMTHSALGELYWVADSNIRVTPDTLERLVHEYTSTDARIVFCPVKGYTAGRMSSIREAAYLNLFVSGIMMAAWQLFRIPVIVGKSLLIERATLESLGGFDRFSTYLAEDYMMGHIYRENRIPISTNGTWVTNVCAPGSVRGFASRVTRWGKMRSHISAGFYILELFANPVGLALLSCLFLGTDAIPGLCLAALTSIIAELTVWHFTDTPDQIHFSALPTFAGRILFKDCLLLGLYFAPFFSNTVTWRGRKIRIGQESRIEPLASHGA